MGIEARANACELAIDLIERLLTVELGEIGELDLEFRNLHARHA